MLLTSFLNDLLTTGSVTLAGRPQPFEVADLRAAEARLGAYHTQDALEMPGNAPPFEAAAASWAVRYLYHAIQLALVRELDEAVIQQQLADFPGTVTPEVIYSVDLTFRYLPDLLRLAKGLAPGDALVARLQATARQWPLSFVGTEPPAAAEAETVILAHPALAQAYIDRIIRTKDQAHAAQSHLAPLVSAALGAHASTLWPDFTAFILPA